MWLSPDICGLAKEENNKGKDTSLWTIHSGKWPLQKTLLCLMIGYYQSLVLVIIVDASIFISQLGNDLLWHLKLFLNCKFILGKIYIKYYKNCPRSHDSYDFVHYCGLRWFQKFQLDADSFLKPIWFIKYVYKFLRMSLHSMKRL